MSGEEVVDKCAYCTDDVRTPYKLVNCRHVFCKDCLAQAREMMKKDPRCPMCRTMSFAAFMKAGEQYIDFGHPSSARMEELKITEEEAKGAMVCTNCFEKPTDFKSTVQCDTCNRIWHATCTIEIVLDTCDEDGAPLTWRCPACMASDVKADKALRSKFFADKARERRRQAELSGNPLPESKKKQQQKKRKQRNIDYDNDDGDNADIKFSGRHLKRTRHFSSGPAAVPRSPGSDTGAASAAVDEDEVEDIDDDASS